MSNDKTSSLEQHFNPPRDDVLSIPSVFPHPLYRDPPREQQHITQINNNDSTLSSVSSATTKMIDEFGNIPPLPEIHNTKNNDDVDQQGLSNFHPP